MKTRLPLCALLITTPIAAMGATLTVGKAASAYPTLAAACAAAKNGDVIEIPAGTYFNDFATLSANVTVEGVSGIVREVATQPPPNEKALLVTTGDIVIKNLAFSGVAIPASEGGNGAGIRYQGGQLTLINDTFAHNQDGLLSNADPTGMITIVDCRFHQNGSGTGYTHNLYVGHIALLTVSLSRFTRAIVGHEFKSRAAQTIITHCAFIDGPNGTASYDIDLPNGGDALLQDNVIQKGPLASNTVMVSFGEEGAITPQSALSVTDNKFYNDTLNHGICAVKNVTSAPVKIQNNVFFGFSPHQIATGPVNSKNNHLLPLSSVRQVKTPTQ